MNKLEKSSSFTNQTFEDIKHINKDGVEYWYARELQMVLNYKEWWKFENVINKAKESCKNSDINVFVPFCQYRQNGTNLRIFIYTNNMYIVF